MPVWLPHFFVLIRRSCTGFDPDFEWRGTLISALAHLLAGAMQSHSMNGIELSRGRGSHRGLFAWGEIGMLNYLVHAMVQRKLMLAMSDL